MVPILNRIRILWLERLVKRHHTKYDFYVNFLPIKLAHLDESEQNKINKISDKIAHKLAVFEIGAGVESQYVKDNLQAEIKSVETKYYWKVREELQKQKRKKLENAERIVSLENSKQTEIDKIKKRWRNISPTQQDVFNYENLKKLSIAEKENAIALLNKKHAEYRSKVEKRLLATIDRHWLSLAASQKLLKDIEKKEDSILEDGIVLKVEDLSMHFGGLKAVDQLSFEVKEGEIFGLIGPNGAGKTTVFNCITRFYRPTKGHMYFRNKIGEVTHLNEIVVHNIIKEGIVRTFQNVEMVWELNVIENLLVAAHTEYMSGFFGHMFNSRLLRQEEIVLRKKAEKILADLGLAAYALAYPYGLPYGILKKIELARTLMVNPKLIILDEPAAGLNDAETEVLADTIRKIRDEYKATIFLVEHDMGLVMNICDTVCAISFGKKLAIGTPKEIQNDKVVREAYLGGE